MDKNQFLDAVKQKFGQVSAVCTCRRTLAVSRGKVTKSAMQAAVPALKTFTPRGGGTSDGFRPTILTATVPDRQRKRVRKRDNKII